MWAIKAEQDFVVHLNYAAHSQSLKYMIHMHVALESAYFSCMVVLKNGCFFIWDKSNHWILNLQTPKSFVLFLIQTAGQMRNFPPFSCTSTRKLQVKINGTMWWNPAKLKWRSMSLDCKWFVFVLDLCQFCLSASLPHAIWSDDWGRPCGCISKGSLSWLCWRLPSSGLSWVGCGS